MHSKSSIKNGIGSSNVNTSEVSPNRKFKKSHTNMFSNNRNNPTNTNFSPRNPTLFSTPKNHLTT